MASEQQLIESIQHSGEGKASPDRALSDLILDLSDPQMPVYNIGILKPTPQSWDQDHSGYCMSRSRPQEWDMN